MPIDYSVLLPADIVFTCSDSIYAKGIRFITGGLKEVNEHHIPNHVGILVPWGSWYFMVEMLGDGIRINSLKNYDGSKKSEGVIHSIWRNDEVSSTSIELITDALAEYVQESVKYDFLGIGEYLGLSKQSPKKFYCSELVAKVLDDNHLLNERKDKWSPVDLWNNFKKDASWVQLKKYTRG